MGIYNMAKKKSGNRIYKKKRQPQRLADILQPEKKNQPVKKTEPEKEINEKTGASVSSAKEKIKAIDSFVSAVRLP